MKAKIIVALVLVVGGVAAWNYNRDATSEIDGYRFVTVERGDVESVVSSSGTLDAVTTVEVGTQVSGRIAEIYVDFNDWVEQGQVVARIDSRLLEITVREAEANLQRLEAQQSQAKREFERASALYRDQLVAEVDLNQARYELAVAEASVTSALVSVQKAEQNLAYATIVAPISGTVVDRGVDVGQTVAASFSAPQLFKIAGDLSRMRILAAVDESDIGLIAEGQTARFTVQAYPDDTFTGVVNQVRLASSTAENVVNYTVVIDVDNADGNLLPGMTATVDFLVEAVADVLKVANAALRFRPTEEMATTLASRRAQGSTRSPDAVTDAERVADRADRSGALAGAETTDTTWLWYLDDGELAAARVRTGLTDGQSTAIEQVDLGDDALEPGMQIIAAVVDSSQSSTSNPFQSQQQGSQTGPPGRGF